MNKPGLSPKLDSEKILYIVILIIITIFIFNMKGVYSLIVKIRTGELFPKQEVVTEQPTDNDDDEEEEEPVEQYEVLKPIGNEKVTCKTTLSSTTGSKVTKIFLYYTEDKLKSLDEQVNYEGISDEYTNYIYSERKKYEKRKSDNINLKGYSVVTTLSGTLSLATSTVVDLSKTELTKITISDTDGIGLYGVYNQAINEAVVQYASMGYECE